MTGLSATDFRVEENGVPQTIAHFSTDVDTPISVGLLLDTRVSMIVFGHLVQELGAARVLLRTGAKPGDEYSLMTFESSVRVREAFTPDVSRIENTLLSLYPRQASARKGTMSLIQAIRRGLAEMKQAKYRKSALVLITESNAERDLDRALREFQAAEIPIFILGFSGFSTELVALPNPVAQPNQREALDIERRLLTKIAVRESVLTRIADETGGRAELLIGDKSEAVERVIAATEEIAAELRGQYLIGYYPKVAAKDASVVRVLPNSSAHHVRFRRLPLDKTILSTK